jgi:predicted transcriptional regulator/transcriptional regulator with XRE-family HTH domain
MNGMSQVARDTLTGSRIRERRVMSGLKQADLARRAGISASYLNLIEHNRRRIGGKLLLDISQVLEVEPSSLSEGAEAGLIAQLREASAARAGSTAELDRTDEFAGRFPGWAELLSLSYQRIQSLEQTVETLNDRLAHDPELAASVHEVLSTVASIRSTAAILVDTEELEPNLRNRFHGNIDKDSRRLADSSKSLVRYLDEATDTATPQGSPQEDVETYLVEHAYHFPVLETGEATPEALVIHDPRLQSRSAQHIARGILEQYKRDAEALPLDVFTRALDEGPFDPTHLATRFRVGVQVVLRRMAALPAGLPGSDCGLVVCDNAGYPIFRKPTPGFVLPRFGVSCPLWPVFQALSAPGHAMLSTVAQAPSDDTQMACYSYAYPVGPPALNTPPLYQAIMLMRPATDAVVPQEVRPIGTTCRLCPRDCQARREPSILREGF